MLKKETKISVALWGGVLLVIAPYIYTILYSLPSTDDFWMASGVSMQTIFLDAVNKANWFWMNWGGMWLYEFLRVLINPLVLFGATSPLLGVELVILFLVFLIALWTLNIVFWKYVLEISDSRYIVGTYLLILVWFLNTEVWTEVFYWFAGNAYMWAMIFVFLTVALEIIYFKKAGFSVGVVLSILGACACSFYSQAVFPCMIFLLFLFFEIKNKKSIPCKKMIPFVFFLIGAISSLIAPGNYARKGESSGIISTFIVAIKDTFILLLDSVFDLFANPVSIVMFTIFIVLGMFALKEYHLEYQNPLILFVLTGICLYVVYFPFALGYGGTMYAPNRMKFAFNMFSVLLFSVDCLYLGNWLRYVKKVTLDKKQLLYGIIALFAFTYICLLPTKYYQELPYMQTVAQSKRVKVANEEWRYLLDNIEMSEDADVVYERSVIDTPIIKWPGVSHETEGTINQHIAEYYNKDSVCVYFWKLN